MSSTLLQRVSAHIITDGGLLSDYALRYYRWTDADLNGAGKVALFRMPGSAGRVNRQAQFPDVELSLLADSDDAVATDAAMLGVLQYLRANFSTAGAFNLFPVDTYSGPTYLANDRALFAMTIRAGTEDH